jgi:hypothetical protein
MRFLYMGFSQEASLRCYRFQGVVPKDRPTKVLPNLEFRLNADMGLFAEHHIPLQDAPALCLQILTSMLSGTEDHDIHAASFAISSADLATFLSTRTAAEESKIARRKPRPKFKPSPSSQLRWPQVK